MHATSSRSELDRLRTVRRGGSVRLGLLLMGLAALSLALIVGVDRTVAGDAPRVGEGEERPRATLRAEDYFPAEPGMRWEYAGWGNEFAQYSREAVHRRGERAQTVHISGAIVAYVYDIYPDRIVLRALHPEIDDGKVDFLDAEGEVFRIILQEPLEEGASWRTMSSIRVHQADPGDEDASPDDEPLHEMGPNDMSPDLRPKDRFIWETRRIEAVGQSHTTPAGTFRNVLVVRVIPDQGPQALEHYAPGIGLIRSEYLYEESIISELAAFHIGRSWR